MTTCDRCGKSVSRFGKDRNEIIHQIRFMTMDIGISDIHRQRVDEEKNNRADLCLECAKQSSKWFKEQWKFFMKGVV